MLTLGLHRPGPRFFDSQRRDWPCFDAYDEEISRAWDNPLTGEGSHEFGGQQEGDLCTVDGYPGRLRYNKDGDLDCMADHPSSPRDRHTLDKVVCSLSGPFVKVTSAPFFEAARLLDLARAEIILRTASRRNLTTDLSRIRNSSVIARNTVCLVLPLAAISLLKWL
jgi:hypothetical protein